MEYTKRSLDCDGKFYNIAQQFRKLLKANNGNKKIVGSSKKGRKTLFQLNTKKTMLVVCVCMYVGTEERA